MSNVIDNPKKDTSAKPDKMPVHRSKPRPRKQFDVRSRRSPWKRS
jgi:hypothetical protein